ncbi:2Fe-2S iron-sulfur cluster binding domain containing protein [Trypanosoma vivax]|nr:2Fe-2S iron-sulfur cluster binding domain containing protein [Trypanosoma vivax]
MSARKEALKPIPGRCPTPGELGKAGWAILHSAAAVFPHNPSDTQQTAFSAFLHGWSHSYACSHCAYHMRRYLEENPPVLTGKFAVNRYLCEFHNAVNERLGKDTYDCDPMNVLRRWHPTFPDMEDQPTVEEQIKRQRQQERGSGGGDSVQQSSSDSPESAVGGQLSNDKEGLWRGRRAGEFSAGWRTAQTQEQRVESRGNHGVSASLEGAPAARWWWFGGSIVSTEPSRADRAASGGAGSAGSDVDSILRKLKACMVYCPDNEKST